MELGCSELQGVDTEIEGFVIFLTVILHGFSSFCFGFSFNSTTAAARKAGMMITSAATAAPANAETMVISFT